MTATPKPRKSRDRIASFTETVIAPLMPADGYRSLRTNGNSTPVMYCVAFILYSPRRICPVKIVSSVLYNKKSDKSMYISVYLL